MGRSKQTGELKINTNMKKTPANEFFSDINFVSIVDNIKGIYTSDGSMSTLLDFERVLAEADLYAFKNWISGELVDGPILGRYSTRCVFMWPHKLMPDPRGALRLINVGCTVTFGKGKIKVPVEVKGYDDFVSGSRYPKMVEKPVWFVEIKIPIELMDDIKEGTIDIADQKIDLSDIEDAYSEDLDNSSSDQEVQTEAELNNEPEMSPMNPGMGM